MMIKRLFKKKRVDLLQSERRPTRRGNIGRYVYLSLLAVLALTILDMWVGKYLFLRAEGMLVEQVTVHAPEYDAVIQELHVQEGQDVSAGQLLARLRSRELITEIARLSASLAESKSKLSENGIEIQSLTDLVDSAARHFANEQKEKARLDDLLKKGLTTARRHSDASRNAYDAEEELQKLQSRLDLAKAEQDSFSQMVNQAGAALQALQDIYQAGEIHAAANGYIGFLPGQTGSVLKTGDVLAEIFHGQRHVLAFIPVGTLYDVTEGDAVYMRAGFSVLRGTIVEKLPRAARLPSEFQRAFQTAQREQLVRIAFDANGDDLPVFTTLSITSLASPSTLAALALGKVMALVE